MSDERKFRAPESDVRPTPQERQEAAEEMRHDPDFPEDVTFKSEDGEFFQRNAFYMGSRVVSLFPKAGTWRDVQLALADLIDPTCTITGSFEDEREAGFSRYGVHVYRLSCGHKFDWQLNEPPSYCPMCGSRIEWEDK